MKEYVKSKNIDVRSIKLMSKVESMFKSYLIEISLENYDTVINASFWPERVGVRRFKGRGNDWRDREELVSEAENREGE